MTNNSLRRTLFALLVVTGTAALEARADDPWDWDWGWRGPKKPTVDMTLGTGVLKDNAFTGVFNDIGSFEVKLGYTRMKGGTSLSIDDKFLFGAYYDDAMAWTSASAGGTGSQMVRLGIGSRGGYAYDFDAVYLYPYNEQTFSLTKIDFARPTGLTAEELDLLGRYEGAFRFGYSAETGLACGLSELLAVRAGYDLTVINPRVLFWKTTGSILLASIGYGVLSNFAKEIVETSPTLGPIMYALLRGGYTYAYYLAMRNDANWPFNGETPLTSQMVKVGITLTF